MGGTLIHGGGGPQVGEVPLLGGLTCLSMLSLILILWGDPSGQDAPSARPGNGNTLSWVQILPC